MYWLDENQVIPSLTPELTHDKLTCHNPRVILLLKRVHYKRQNFEKIIWPLFQGICAGWSVKISLLTVTNRWSIFFCSFGSPWMLHSFSDDAVFSTVYQTSDARKTDRQSFPEREKTSLQALLCAAVHDAAVHGSSSTSPADGALPLGEIPSECSNEPYVGRWGCEWPS